MPVSGGCIEQIGVLAGTWADRSRVGDSDKKNAGDIERAVDNIIASVAGSLVGEVGIKAWDFWDFLPKSELISQLIVYESKFSFFLYTIISASVHSVSSSSSNVSCKDLAIVYFYYFCTYILYFNR